MDKLIFCPFCGSTDIVIFHNHSAGGIGADGYFGLCNHCQIEGPFDLGESGAREKWNQRTLPWIPYPDNIPQVDTLDIGEEYLCWVGYPFNRIMPLQYFHENWWSSGAKWTDKVEYFCALTSLPAPLGVEEND